MRTLLGIIIVFVAGVLCMQYYPVETITFMGWIGEGLYKLVTLIQGVK